MPILLLTAALMPAASVSAQTQAFSPVDQAVADLDPLATSFRRIHPSLAVYNPNSSIYQIGGSDPLRNAAGSVDPRTGLAVPRNFVFEQPGVRVFLNRPDYLVLTNEDLRRPEFGLNVAPVIDRAFIELIPPGAVFDLVPRDDRTPLLIDEDDSAPDRRLGTPLRGLDRMGDPFDSDGLVGWSRQELDPAGLSWSVRQTPWGQERHIHHAPVGRRGTSLADPSRRVPLPRRRDAAEPRPERSPDEMMPLPPSLLDAPIVPEGDDGDGAGDRDAR